MSLTVNANQVTSYHVGAAASQAGERDTIAPSDALYIPSLDGIRALSFFLVFLSHAGLGSIIPGGFGVTVFFLLSGFLITTLLRLEFSRYGHISLSSFYLRRVLRILPPLYISMALAIGMVLIANEHSAIPFEGTLAQALQVSNYFLIFSSSGAILPGTGVFWSLAIEEHFYLLFPLLYVWICPKFSANRQAMILAALCALALAWRCILYFYLGADPIRTYYGTDTRFDSILLGCVFAVVANPILNDHLSSLMIRKMRWLLPLSIGVLLGTFLVREDGFRETIRYTLQGLALVPLFIAAIHFKHSWPVVFLNLPVMRFLGVLSYSLYLCHAIFLDFVHRTWMINPFYSGALSLAFALSFATLVHYWVERPCTRIRKRLSKVLKG